jgi:hypothetical protein
MGKRRIDRLIPLSAYDSQRKQHCGLRRYIACRLRCLALPSRQPFVEMQLALFVARTGEQRLRQRLQRIIFKMKIFSHYCELLRWV